MANKVNAEKQLMPLLMSDMTKLADRVKNDAFLRIVNQEPPAEFIKIHPFAKGVKYIPIDKVELMLTNVFKEWHVEVLHTGQILNSITVTVRLHYVHPVTGEKLFQDGVGAVPAKTEKDAKASDMASILSDAVMTGLPAAKSYAIKDAAEHIGILFGRDINRKDTLPFTASYENAEALLEQLDANEEKKQAIKDSHK